MKNKDNYYKKIEKEIISIWKKSGPAKRWKILDVFCRQIAFLQHERLIHLLITLFFGGFCLLFGLLASIFGNVFLLLIFLLVLIMEMFYVFHYYFLENTCQRWQKIAFDLEKELIKNKKTSKEKR